jgi:hypothetical protein
MTTTAMKMMVMMTVIHIMLSDIAIYLQRSACIVKPPEGEELPDIPLSLTGHMYLLMGCVQSRSNEDKV